MKGVVFEQQGAVPKVVDNLSKPKPSATQVLVKSLWMAINPVDAMMANYGILVTAWPLQLGVDASGIVVEAGSEAESKHGLRPGTYVCGCTRLGSQGYSSGQEYFLMDAAVTIPKPQNISTIQAATLGVGIETAALGIFAGLNVELPNPKTLPQEKNEWVVILGGASSVGKFAIQLAKIAGYKVIASCSRRSASVVEGLGAKTFDYGMSVEKQVQKVIAITGEVGAYRIFDAVASDNPELAIDLIKQSKNSLNHFSTTNDWNSPDEIAGSQVYKVGLGPIGRPNADGLNSTLETYIPVLVDLVESGAIQIPDHHVVGNGSMEDLIEAYNFQRSGNAGSKKVVVKVQDE